MTLLRPPQRASVGVIDPAGVERKERALLAVIGARPAVTTAEIIAALEPEKRSAVIARLMRMSDRGAVTRISGGLWSIPRAEFATADDAAAELGRHRVQKRWSLSGRDRPGQVHQNSGDM
jgi:hypothetical protein